MAAVDFPPSPTANVTTHIAGGITYLYRGSNKWEPIISSLFYTEYMYTNGLLAFDQDLWPFAGSITKIVKLPGVATVSYTKNGGAPVALVFNATTITTNDSTSTPIAV